jgi:cytochrome c
LGCHRLDKKLIGPSYTDIAGKEYSVDELVRLMQEPQPENWPDYPPMASMSFVAVEDLTTIAEWIVQLGEE